MKFILLALLIASSVYAHQTYNAIELVNVENIVDGLNDGHTLNITTDVKELNGTQWVTVEWSNVLEPTNKDFIAVYPAPLDLKKTEPIKYQNCSVSHTHLSHGKGQIRFKMINMRYDIVFVYFTGGLSSGYAIAATDPLPQLQPNEPMQVHLALVKEEASMRVTWVTKNAKNAAVYYGVSASSMVRVEAQDSSYSRDDMCGPPANTTGWIEPGTIHSAVLPSLPPSSKIFYRYGSDDGGWKESYFFTPPKVGADSSVVFSAFGDMGQAEEDHSLEQAYMKPSLNTTRLMGRDVDAVGLGLVVHIGDISYARGHAGQWENFHYQIEQTVARHVPYMTVPGNHERDWPDSASIYGPLVKDSGGECGVAYERRFIMPTSAEDEPWYSFNYGPVHFVLISTEHAYARGSKQNTWVETDLKAVDRSVTPWIVFGGHRPMYVDSTWRNRSLAGDQDVAHDLREAFDDMLNKYHVDLGIFGHHHSYQKTCPVHRQICIPNHFDGSHGAPLHMVIGMAGFAFSTGIHPHWRRPLYMREVDISHHGYMRGSANSTHLVMDFVDDSSGDVIDSTVLVKKSHKGTYLS